MLAKPNTEGDPIQFLLFKDFVLRWLKGSVLITILFSSTALLARDFEFPRAWRLNYDNVQLLNRNNDLGLQYYAQVEFQKWQDLPMPGVTDVVVIGLTKSGGLYHLVDHNGKRAMRLLSGSREIKDFLVGPDGNILAVDDRGQSLFFDADKWSRSPIKSLSLRGTGAWLLSSLSVLTLTGIISWPELHHQWMQFLIFNGMSSFTLAMSSGFYSLMRFDFMNSNPDGFRDLTGVAWNPREIADNYGQIKKRAEMTASSQFLRMKCSLANQIPIELAEKIQLR